MIKDVVISVLFILLALNWWVRVEQEGLTKKYYRELINCQIVDGK